MKRSTQPAHWNHFVLALKLPLSDVTWLRWDPEHWPKPYLGATLKTKQNYQTAAATTTKPLHLFGCQGNEAPPSVLALPTKILPIPLPLPRCSLPWGLLISLGLAALSAVDKQRPKAQGWGCRELAEKARLSCWSARHMSNPIWERILLSLLIRWQVLLKNEKKKKTNIS